MPQFLAPADNPNTPPRLFQLPFIRQYASGPAVVSIFFLLGGYVTAMKPIRLANAGLPDDARKHIASSVLRRVVRICLPSSLATLVAWTATQLRLFTYVPYVELNGMWLALGTPKPSAGLLLAIKDYIKACVTSLPQPLFHDLPWRGLTRR